jgi:CubicO group peptidase (beta-lactamase class C family)
MRIRHSLLLLLLAGLCAGSAHAQELDSATKARIDAAAQKVLADTGVPSASIGIARDGVTIYTAAFGKARIEPALPASAEMLYPIGSVSKQFTAACVLLLVEEGKMKLDDPVARWFPEFTQARDVTVRNLLTHTSGYSDYAPQDYTIPAWTRPIDHVALIHEWATKPLDFQPGTRWQYSNTNFAIAGMIVEKVSGQPFWQFLSTRILKPVGITHAIDLNLTRAGLEVQGYMGNALGPPRIATLEFPGWFFADGELAMPVADLLRWDMAVANRAPILKPASWDTLETPMKLKDGSETTYGLGINVRHVGGRLALMHGGEVGGYVSQNTVYPNEKLSIAVLTNAEASTAAAQIATAIAPLLLPAATASAKRSSAPPAKQQTATLPASPEAEKQARTILDGLIHNKIDRKLFTDDANFYFSAQTIADFASSLAPLGPVTRLKNTATQGRGGMIFRSFEVEFKDRTLELTTYTMPDGKLEQFLIGPS